MSDFFPLSEKIKHFGSIFKNAGFKLYVVGGAVRDYLLNIENSDFDFCTDAEPSDIKKLFSNVIPTGIKHGTVTVLFKGDSFEVTTFRTESSYSDSRHPDSIKFVKSLKEDLSRRDFTVNAFAADCTTGEITDLFNGQKDLSEKTIRCIGNPEERFSEDALRLMRLCRFCSKLGFSADNATKNAATKLCKSIKKVSSERIQDELFKILLTPKPSVGLRLMEETGLLKEVLPEVFACREINQIKVNNSNLLDHIFICTDTSAKMNYPLSVRLSALLHDIGKPFVMQKNAYGFLRFPEHAEKGAELAKSVLKRLKCSNDAIFNTCNLIRHHSIIYNPGWADGKIKRFINSIGRNNLEYYFNLLYCDSIASFGNYEKEKNKEFKERIQKALTEPLTLKDLKVSGSDLIKEGINGGKTLGDILNQLLEMVLDYPILNKKSILLEISLNLYHNCA